MKLNYITFLLVLSFFNCQTFFGQIKTERSAKELSRIQSYGAKAKKLNIDAAPEFFYDRNININKKAEFKEMGLDLEEMIYHLGSFNYKEYSVFSDCIVDGKIVSKEYITDLSAVFHTKFKLTSF